jgi:hypothetical protein
MQRTQREEDKRRHLARIINRSLTGSVIGHMVVRLGRGGVCGGVIGNYFLRAILMQEWNLALLLAHHGAEE